jgi:hypothetical protein
MKEVTNTNSDKVAPAAASAATEQATTLSQHVFADPRDFLKTIQDNFQEMSHDHRAISEADLKTDMKTGSTEQIRAAATIAEQHFSDLDRISDVQRDKPGINKDDISFATDMNDHNILGDALNQGGLDAMGALSGFVVGAASTLTGVDELTTGVTLFGSASAGAILPAIWIGSGALALGVGGYAAYLGATEYSRMNQQSNADAAKFKSWM